MNKIFKNLLVFLLKAIVIFILLWIAYKLTEGMEVSAARLAIYGSVLATVVDYVFDVILKNNNSETSRKISSAFQWKD